MMVLLPIASALMIPVRHLIPLSIPDMALFCAGARNLALRQASPATLLLS